MARTNYNPFYDPQYQLYNDPEIIAQGGPTLRQRFGAWAKGHNPFKSPYEGVASDNTGPVSATQGLVPLQSVAGNVPPIDPSALKSNPLKGMWSNLKAGKGIMPKYAGLAKAGMGIGAGISAIKGINEYQNAKKDTDALVDDILQSAAGNEMLRYDLSADQLELLRKLRNGTYDLTGDFDAGDLLGNIGNIATGAGLGFVTGGGPVGAILGGASGVIDGVSSSMVGNQEKITQDLQNLYDALYESEMRSKSMKRDAAYQRYANSLY